MSRVYFENGIKVGDLERGVEIEIDHQESSSDESDDEIFDDELFDEYKKMLCELGIKSKDCLLPFDELRKLMKPVTEDGCIMKQIIKWGVGIPLPEKSIVIIHYDAFLEHQKEPFDSTRRRNKPFKFLTGDGNVIQGLELGIQTMKKGEISKFLVKSNYAYGDMGCPPRIPGGAEILYLVEVLNFYDSKDAIEFEEMTPEEQKKADFNKISAVFHCEHQMGNELFRNKHYKPAIARYRKMVKLLEDVSVENEEQDEKRKQYLLKLYLNLAQSYINIKKSEKAIIYAHLALQIDEKNPKALYRKGYALYLNDNFDDAMHYLLKAKRYKPYENDINKVLIEIEHKRRQHKEWEDMFCKKMFNTNISEKKEITLQESIEVKEFREVLEKEFKRFIDSTEKELSFSPGYSEWQIEIVEDLSRKYKLAFVNKIQIDQKIIKVVKS